MDGVCGVGTSLRTGGADGRLLWLEDLAPISWMGDMLIYPLDLRRRTALTTRESTYESGVSMSAVDRFYDSVMLFAI